MTLFVNEARSSYDYENKVGTTVKQMNFIPVAVDPASLAANTDAETDVTIRGVNVGDFVSANQPASLEAGLVFVGVRVKAADTVSIRLRNLTASPIDGASRTWGFMVYKLV